MSQGQTDVSRKTLADVPFCRIWIYFVVSTSEILTCVLGTITSVAIGNCASSGDDDTVDQKTKQQLVCTTSRLQHNTSWTTLLAPLEFFMLDIFH